MYIFVTNNKEELLTEAPRKRKRRITQVTLNDNDPIDFLDDDYPGDDDSTDNDAFLDDLADDGYQSDIADLVNNGDLDNIPDDNYPGDAEPYPSDIDDYPSDTTDDGYLSDNEPYPGNTTLPEDTPYPGDDNTSVDAPYPGDDVQTRDTPYPGGTTEPQPTDTGYPDNTTPVEDNPYPGDATTPTDAPYPGDTGAPQATDTGYPGDVTQQQPADDNTTLITPTDTAPVDDTDYNVDAGGDDNPNAPPVDNPDGEEQQQGRGIGYDSMRNYSLYLEYNKLYEAIDKYIDRVNNITSDDKETNSMIKYCMNKLYEVKQLCFDYMVIKFEQSTYYQNRVFYQTLIVSIQLIFDTIQKIMVSINQAANNKK